MALSGENYCNTALGGNTEQSWGEIGLSHGTGDQEVLRGAGCVLGDTRSTLVNGFLVSGVRFEVTPPVILGQAGEFPGGVFVPLLTQMSPVPSAV